MLAVQPFQEFFDLQRTYGIQRHLDSALFAQAAYGGFVIGLAGRRMAATATHPCNLPVYPAAAPLHFCLPPG